MERRQFLVSAVAVVGLAGCSALPGSGPASRDIISNATASLKESAINAFRYVQVDLTQQVLAVLGDPGPGSFYKSFGKGRGGASEITVGVGDTVQVTIFESASGGLFIPNDAGSRPGNYVTLPNQTVDQKGYLTVPYAGLIMAKGRNLPDIQADIVQKLKSRAIEPQAVVSVVGQTSSQATVIGQVGAPTKININQAGDRVLDVLAKAGGISDPGYETFVTLQRKGTKATIYFLNLVTNPQENIFIETGDILYVYQEQRAYTAFGASGQSGQFKFQQEHLFLSDAVGKAGGLLDAQADPGQVLLYRIESRENLQKMDIDLKDFAPEIQEIPTIYRANFRDPSSFFVAKKFYVHDHDVLYVTNADKVELLKFLGLVTAVPDAAGSIANDGTAIGNAVRPLYQRNLGQSF